jgi:hypothetical protein
MQWSITRNCYDFKLAGWRQIALSVSNNRFVKLCYGIYATVSYPRVETIISNGQSLFRLQELKSLAFRLDRDSAKIGS